MLNTLNTRILEPKVSKRDHCSVLSFFKFENANCCIQFARWQIPRMQEVFGKEENTPKNMIDVDASICASVYQGCSQYH
jgi:hypothetical protein